MKAYIQIAVESGKDVSVHGALKKMPQISDAHIVFGDWDVVAMMTIENPEELGQLIVGKIRSIPGVKLTKTLVVAK